jgi:hypothetical protein
VAIQPEAAMALSRRRSSAAADSQSSRTGIITIRLKGCSSVKVDILIRSALLEQVVDALALGPGRPCFGGRVSAHRASVD